MDTHRHYRSIFWPIVLLGVGAVWLLSNLGYIQAIDLGFLVRLWPILLIIIGLDILFGRIAPWLSALLGLAVIGGLILVLIYAPSLGLARPAELTTERLVEPIGGATAATVDLRLSLEPVTVTALTGSENLIEADLKQYGKAYLTASGETQKKIVLGKESGTVGNNWFTWPSLTTGWDDNEYWNIGLTDQIPLDLSVDGSLGSMDLNLNGLILTEMNVNASMGSMDLALPENTDPYEVDINGSAGSLNVNLPENTNLTLRLDGSAGSSNFELPAVYSLRVEVMEGGLGSVNLPHGLTRVSGSGETQEGVWESADYATAINKLLVILTHVGPGSINFN